MLRLITEGVIGPKEAVHAYHGVLQQKGIKAHRSLDRDLAITEQAMSYDESSSGKSRVMMGESSIRGSEKAKRPSDLPAGKVSDASGQGEAPCALDCLLYTSPSPRDLSTSRMPSSA